MLFTQKSSFIMASLLSLGLSVTSCAKHEKAEGSEAFRTEEIATKQGEAVKATIKEPEAKEPATYTATTAPASGTASTATASATSATVSTTASSSANTATATASSSAEKTATTSETKAIQADSKTTNTEQKTEANKVEGEKGMMNETTTKANEKN